MLSRLSANVLLKSVVATMAFGIVLVLTIGAFDAWQTLRTASRLADISAVSSDLFRAMASLRLNRSFTIRALSLDTTVDPVQLKQIEEARAVGTPALRSALVLLPTIDFAGRDDAVRTFEQLDRKLASAEKDSLEDMAKLKPQRRPGTAADLQAATTGLIDLIQKTSTAIDMVARNGDAFVDQMMSLQDAGWALRSDAADLSVTISNALAYKQRFSPEAQLKFATLMGRTQSAWDTVQRTSIGLPPASLVATAIDKAKATYFAQEYAAKRDDVLSILTSDRPFTMTSGDWTRDSVGRLSTLNGIYEAALDMAGDRAQSQVAAARTNLIVRLVLLTGALVLAVGSMMMIGRRVIGPLQQIRAAMVKVADGDLSVEVPYRDRTDEIGSLADALATFKQNAVEKERIEEEQRKRREQAELRQQAIERYIGEFEAGIGEALKALGTAAGDMRRTSETLTSTAAQTNGQARDAASSSSDASQNVQTVAAASEELSSSIHEISRQVSHAATVAKRAVAETEETDATVQGLTNAAHKIGEIVNLITAIANQTNLLALNATIEAARAGEAGKGFAVVASEVKTLAGQTAKATEDISGQVGAIQSVADQALAAMRRIGSTIAEVSSVASSIAAAVEEQGAATQEITRNTQEAARRTLSVSENIAGVTACADQTGTAAGGVKSSAEVLNTQADTLRSRVDDFLQKIRAA